MWMFALVALAAVVVYIYSISGTIKVAKPGCSSCPHKINEDEKAKID